jgi:hypothetical protein
MKLLILDLSRVRFCDASGLAVLVGAQHRAQLLGVTLYLAAPRPQIAKVLRITGLDRGLRLPTVPEALAHATAHHMALQRYCPNTTGTDPTGLPRPEPGPGLQAASHTRPSPTGPSHTSPESNR